MDSQLVNECINETNIIIRELQIFDPEYKIAIWTAILNNLIFQKLSRNKLEIGLDNLQDSDFKSKMITLSELYNNTKPSTHYDKILLFAYWLIISQNKNQFEPKDIEDCYNKVILKHPKNLHDLMRKLTGGNKAYLERSIQDFTKLVI